VKESSGSRKGAIVRTVLYTLLSIAFIVGACAWLMNENKKGIEEKAKQQLQADLNLYGNDQPFLEDYPIERDYRMPLDPSISEVHVDDQYGDLLYTKSVLPEITAARDDPHELPFVRKQLTWLLQQVKSGEIIMKVTSNEDFTGGASVYDYKLHKRMLLFSGRGVEIVRRGMNAAAYHDFLVQTTVHESIHLPKITPEFDKKNGPHQPHVTEESRTWIIMIKEVIRPWYAQGRYPSSMSWKISKLFAECGDTATDRWMRFVDVRLS